MAVLDSGPCASNPSALTIGTLAAFANFMFRRAFCPTLVSLAVPLFAMLQGCSFMHDQVAYTTATKCMERECGDEQGAARQQCESECSKRYGR